MQEEPQLEPETEIEPGLEIDPEDLRPRPWVLPERKRVLLVLGILVGLLLLVLLPPYISVNRYRRQIARSIGTSLGRPVHMDSVSLNVLPMPGLTLENFVVTEDPAFGSEPVIQARSVKVALRVWSLWKRRVEFSRISFDEPSVNLVHRADGRWNIESILLQASKIEAAPTAQKSAGEALRFPYIEATGARVNVKMGLEKMPLALTEADFALWLPEPQQWRLRLEGHLTRTDAGATDTGIVRVQGTLGKAATLKDVPLDLTGEWVKAPLGGASLVLLGRDAGLRGTMNLHTSVSGTVGENAVDSRLELNEVRRSDFVPEQALAANVACKARAMAVFHSLQAVQCAWQTGGSAKGAPYGVTLQGEVPSLLHPGSAQLDVRSFLAVSQFLDILRVASSRVSPALRAEGSANGSLQCCAEAPSGEFAADPVRLVLGDAMPFLNGPVSGQVVAGELTLAPIDLDLGATQPATLAAHVDGDGYTLHLTGPVLRTRALLLARALPQFGDGLESALPEAIEAGAVEAPIRVDLVSTRTWNGGQTWAPAAAARPARGRRRSRP